MTIKEFLKKFKVWGLSISSGLVLVVIGVAIWQEEADYVFYGIPAVLALLYLSMPIALFISASREVEIRAVAFNDGVIQEREKAFAGSSTEMTSIEVSENKEPSKDIEQEDLSTKELDPSVYELMKESELRSMTVSQLRDVAKDKGLTGYSSLKKADLIELLKK